MENSSISSENSSKRLSIESSTVKKEPEDIKIDEKLKFDPNIKYPNIVCANSDIQGKISFG